MDLILFIKPCESLANMDLLVFALILVVIEMAQIQTLDLSALPIQGCDASC